MHNFSTLLDRPFKIRNQDIISLEKETIEAGGFAEVRIPVGKMPSDTRLYISTFIYRAVEPGPTVLILGGVHGDEINGIEIVGQMLSEDYFSKISRGNVIAIPLLNVFGFNNFSRDLPDGKDVNRSFPGEVSGSLASRVAATLTKKILPYIDFAIDLHTGGASRYNHPQTRYSSKQAHAATLAMMFDAPFMIDQPLIPKSFRKVSSDHNAIAIVYEGGESIRLDGLSIETGKRGVKKVLHHLDMIANPGLTTSTQTIHIKKSEWQRAAKSGIFIWSKCSNQFVEKGELLGVIKDPYGLTYAEVFSKYKGYIFGHNNASVVNQGDALFNIGVEYEIIGF
jgi:uncharacterized protein